MISLIVPTEERDFNQNSVGPGGLSYRTVGVTAPRPGSGQTSLLTAHHNGKLSPNDNSCLPAALTAGTERLDNRPASLSLDRHLPPVDDSSSDDTTCGSLAPLAVDDTSDEAMSPADRPRQPSPVRRQDRRASSLAPHSARSGKLKRVSFGSSKGSMVETLIYDYEPTPARSERDCAWQAGGRRPAAGRHSTCHGGGGSSGGAAPAIGGGRPAGSATRPLSAPPTRPASTHHNWPEEAAAPKATSRVRVTYYESRRPLSVSGSSDGGSDVSERTASRRSAPPQATAAAAVTASVTEMPSTYIVSSVDAGWENPFRPGGELSKEADQIVRAIQSGRPLDSSVDSADGPEQPAGPADSAAGGDTAPAGNGHISPPANGQPAVPAPEGVLKARAASQTAAAPPRAGAADSPPPGATLLAAQPPGTVEVRHSVAAAPEGAAQVERVALKKKPRGRCCVVQ